MRILVTIFVFLTIYLSIWSVFRYFGMEVPHATMDTFFWFITLMIIVHATELILKELK